MARMIIVLTCCNRGCLINILTINVVKLSYFIQYGYLGVGNKGKPCKILFMLLATVILSACTVTSEIDDAISNPPLPRAWQQTAEVIPVRDGWLSSLNDGQVKSYVARALDNNYSLKQQALAIESSRQRVAIASSDRWPSLDLTLSNGRVRDNNPKMTVDNATLDLALRFELDVWGKLSDGERQAAITLLSEEASYEEARQQLVAEVVSGWFSIIEARQLFSLSLNRLDVARQNLDIIESGYRQGLNSALDVYLTRNELNSELSRLSEREAIVNARIRALERLMGVYPETSLQVDAVLPLFETNVPTGVPSALITRKPVLQANWYKLLAADAGLAVAHKQRFPSLDIRATVGDSQESVGDLFSSGSLAWSLLGSLSAPIFNAGRLKANEEVARLELKQLEQNYLDALYTAFEEVENRLTQDASLYQRYQATSKAVDNARFAETLSFEQYRKGLVSYTTVLDAQSRSFDAQSLLIEIQSQRAINRVRLHVALGGDFESRVSP